MNGISGFEAFVFGFIIVFVSSLFVFIIDRKLKKFEKRKNEGFPKSRGRE